MTALQVLRKARALVAKGWCQGATARGRSGKPVDDESRSAVEFCVVGALWRVAGGDFVPRIRARGALKQVVGDSLISFNDAPGRKKATVLRAFDRAIAAVS